MSSLYVPGYGNISRDEMAIRKVCRDYDSNLVFQRSQRNGHMTIFQRMVRDSEYVKHWEAADLEDGDLFPLRAFSGRLPSPDEVGKWLYESDQTRNDLLAQIDKRNGKRKQDMDDRFQQEAHATAEFLEHGLRKLGNDTGRLVSTANDGKRRRTPKLPD